MAKKRKKLSNGWEPFDDCDICQAMSKADDEEYDLSGKELLEAFAKANKHSPTVQKPKVWDSTMNIVKEVDPNMFVDDPDLLTKEQIAINRRIIEEELEELLEECNSDFNLNYIKSIIYEEEDTDDMMKIVAIFDDGDISHISNALELAGDAWNYFPHKVLGGLSPAEKWLEK